MVSIPLLEETRPQRRYEAFPCGPTACVRMIPGQGGLGQDDGPQICHFLAARLGQVLMPSEPPCPT